jgi:hypothetical protein
VATFFNDNGNHDGVVDAGGGDCGGGRAAEGEQAVELGGIVDCHRFQAPPFVKNELNFFQVCPKGRRAFIS